MQITEQCLVADYVNHGNYTILVIVEPKTEWLLSTNGSFQIKDMIVANSTSEIDVEMVNDFSLSAAYPNPFNPSTSFEINIPEAGHLSIKVYNISNAHHGL